MKKQRRFIVSIDGGGIRGLIPLLLLKVIKDAYQQHSPKIAFTDRLSLVAGTSAGAIISAGIVFKNGEKSVFSVEDILSLFQERGKQLFNLNNPGSAPSEGLRLLLKRIFNSATLSSLAADYFLVSYDISENKPFVFSNERKESKQIPLSLALAACSAVPDYFKPVEWKNHLLVDGILAAKNPAYLAYEYARRNYPHDEIILLSIGTGQMSGEFYDAVEKEVDAVDKQLMEIQKDDPSLHYFRFQPPIVSADQRMDNVSAENIQALLNDTLSYLQQQKSTISQLIYLLA